MTSEQLAPKVTEPWAGAVLTAQVKLVSSTSVMVVDSVAWPSSGTVMDAGPVTSGGSLTGVTSTWRVSESESGPSHIGPGVPQSSGSPRSVASTVTLKRPSTSVLPDTVRTCVAALMEQVRPVGQSVTEKEASAAAVSRSE